MRCYLDTVGILLVFAVSLVVAVLISDLASRSVLSTAVLFLVAGMVAGRGGAGWIQMDPKSAPIEEFFTIALFSVLFTDGMRMTRSDLGEGWRLSSRPLLVGTPLTLLGTAFLCHWLTPLTWYESLVVGAALSPTDPLFAAAIIGRKEVSRRVRRLLNLESGLNDGIALPAVLLLLGAIGGQTIGIVQTLQELGLGVAIGFAVPWVVTTALDSRSFAATGVYERLGGISIGLTVFALTAIPHANAFLAAFVAGITISLRSPQMRASFVEFGETISELLKLGAVLLFGSMLSLEFFKSIPLSAYLFLVLVILIVRPIALVPALTGMNLTRREWLAIVWFGPKGFASLLFAFIVLDAGVENSQKMAQLIGLVVAASIIAHSSTDALVARSFKTAEESRNKEAA
jgi:NhaP-type Na+/H+ or K+/H+ antiporter